MKKWVQGVNTNPELCHNVIQGDILAKCFLEADTQELKPWL